LYAHVTKAYHISYISFLKENNSLQASVPSLVIVATEDYSHKGGHLLPTTLQRIVDLFYFPSLAIDNSQYLSKLKFIMSHLHHSSLTVTLLLSVVLLLVTRTLAAPPQLNRLIANPAPPFNLPPVADVSSMEEVTAAI